MHIDAVEEIRQLIGEPIDPFGEEAFDPDDAEAVLALHRRIQGAVQALLNRVNP